MAGRSYDVACAVGSEVVCRAGDGAAVRFSRHALDAYTSAAAAAYCAAHGDQAGAACRDDTSAAGGTSSDSSPPPSSADDSSSRCDPNYAGACLDPDASDYDCAGGSGDGPEYTGEVRVVGADPFDLDRDGDGVGCDT